MNNIFTEIYEKSKWSNNNNTEYNGGSGPGSYLFYNIKSYVPFLKSFITMNNISSVVDLGCGDFVSGKYIYDNLNITYYGYDIYEKMINHHKNIYINNTKYNFNHSDIFNDRHEIINADLCILKTF